MPIYEREKKYIKLLSEREYTVSELAAQLFISEPTVRRDLSSMKQSELVDSKRGVVRLKVNSPDKRIPAFIRDFSNNEGKQKIAKRAAELIKDGMVIMLDASTTACCLVPYLAEFRSILVITSGARTATALASLGISTICTGGELIPESYSFIGGDAIRTLSSYNADIAFFSCRALSDDGLVTDPSIAENEVRRVMIEKSKSSYLLVDKSKLGKTTLNTLCKAEDISGVITD